MRLAAFICNGTGFVYPNSRRFRLDQNDLYSGNSFPAPVSTSYAASGFLISESGVGFVLLEAFSLLWLFGRQEFNK